MIDVIWSDNARSQYFDILNYLYDNWGENSALKFQERIFKIEDLLATGIIKYKPSRKLGYEKCVIDKYNSLIIQRTSSRIEIQLLVNNLSDHDY